MRHVVKEIQITIQTLQQMSVTITRRGNGFFLHSILNFSSFTTNYLKIEVNMLGYLLISLIKNRLIG
jgi:hypothetical protein